MLSADQEIENLRGVVARHFTVYGIVVTPLALTFQVARPAGGNVEKPFDALRRDLVPKDYIPSITEERGELLVHIQRRPKQRFTGLSVNVTMLLLTVLTTVFFGGAYNWSQYVGEPLLSLDAILNGTVFFTLPLLAILGFHEMGHYVVAKRYKMQASLPFFIPSIPPLGTFGAFISMRDPLPSRRALLDVGASGPLVGFAIAIPVTLAGLFLTAAHPHVLLPVGNEFQVTQSSLFYGFLKLFFPMPENVAPHPLAFAGWVGLFVTAINLLPAGQLDGGHIARALLGNRQSLISWGAIGLLVLMGAYYSGWFIFAFLILLIGVRHPPPLNDLSRLDAGRTLVGIAAVVILVSTFVVQPFTFVPVQQGITFETVSGQALPELVANVTPASTAFLNFSLNDTSTLPDDVHLVINPNNLNSANFGLTLVNVTIGGHTTFPNATSATFTLGSGQRAIVALRVDVPASATLDSTWSFSVQALLGTTNEGPELPITLHIT
jgi:membrane-associated protease RseP (regulator of RpoE activity)